MAALSGGGDRARGGVALPLALVLIVALGLLGAGVLALGQHEATAAHASVAWTRARLVARGAVRAAVEVLSPERLAEARRSPAAMGGSLAGGSVEGVEYGADLAALGREWFLVRGWGREAPGRAEAEAAALVWSLEPGARVGAAPAVLVHGGPLSRAPDAVVDGSGVGEPGEGAPAEACGPWAAVLDSVLPTGRLAATAHAAPDSLRPLPRLGLLGPADLRDRVPGRVSAVSGAVRPRPRSAAEACDDASDNWGSPTDLDGPCGARRVALYAEHDLVVEAGEGQGLLLVEGSLTLGEGVVFAGLAVVRDTLRLGPGARFAGLVRSGGPAVLGTGARVEGRACAALLALDGVPALGVPLPAPGGPWVRPF